MGPTRPRTGMRGPVGTRSDTSGGHIDRLGAERSQVQILSPRCRSAKAPRGGPWAVPVEMNRSIQSRKSADWNSGELILRSLCIAADRHRTIASIRALSAPGRSEFSSLCQVPLVSEGHFWVPFCSLR